MLVIELKYVKQYKLFNDTKKINIVGLRELYLFIFKV